MKRRWLISTGVYAALLGIWVGFWGQVFLSSDSLHYYAMAEAWFTTRFRAMQAEEYLETRMPHRRLFRIIGIRGEPVFFYPPGMAIVLWPGLRLGDRLFTSATLAGWSLAPYPIGRVLGAVMEILLLTLVAMLCLEDLITRWGAVPPGAARWGTVAAFLGTPWMYYATRDVLFSHAAELALWIVGLWAMGRADAQTRRPSLWGWLTGWAWGCTVAIRYAMGPAVGLLLGVRILRWIRERRGGTAVLWSLGCVAGMLPWMAYVLWYQATFMESIGTTGYPGRLFVWHYPWTTAIAWIAFRFWAIWLHPMRGFGWWHPLLWLAVSGWMKLRPAARQDLIAGMLGLSIPLWIYHDWWGGVSFGQRLLMGIIPWIALGVAVSLHAHRHASGPFGRRMIRSIGVCATVWNVILALGFTGGAWQGYADNRLGQRYTVTHLWRRMLTEPREIQSHLWAATWTSPGHIRRWWFPPKVVQYPPMDGVPSETATRQTWRLVTRHRSRETVRWIVQVFSAPPYRFPDRWVLTVWSRPVQVKPGITFWQIRVGYPSPFLEIRRGDTPLEIRDKTQHLTPLLTHPSWDRGRVRAMLVHLPHRDTEVFNLRPHPPCRPRDALMCQRFFVAHGVLPLPRWFVPPGSRVLAFAWPFGRPPWYQGERQFPIGGLKPVLFAPMRITLAWFRGHVVLCREPVPAPVP